MATPAPAAAATGTSSAPFSLVKNMNQGALGTAEPDMLTAVGDTLYFVQEISPYGRELWRTDGTAAGTRIVKDVYRGVLDSDIYEMGAAGSRVFFGANDNIHGNELWVSDGTEAGTRMVKDIVPGASGAFPVDFR